MLELEIFCHGSTVRIRVSVGLSYYFGSIISRGISEQLVGLVTVVTNAWGSFIPEDHLSVKVTYPCDEYNERTHSFY